MRESECGIADDAAPVTCGIARVAQAQQVGSQVVFFCRQQQPVNGRSAAGLIVRDRPAQADDAPRSFLINRLGIPVGQEVGKVRTDHDECLGPTPQRFQYLGDFCRRGVPHSQWYQFELAKHRLQEWQLHFHGVLPRMSCGADDHLGQVCKKARCICIQFNLSQWRGEGCSASQRQATHRNPVDRPQQHHASHAIAHGRKLSVGQCRRRARVDIASMGHDQYLG